MNADEIVPRQQNGKGSFKMREFFAKPVCKPSELAQVSSKKLSGWDEAISDAKKGIERLKAAIAHCEEMKATGEPWPGSAGKN